MFTDTINLCRTQPAKQEEIKQPAEVKEKKGDEVIVPDKFADDVSTLYARYGDLTKDKVICITLHDALTLLPRPKRPRADAYNALAKWLKENLEVTLIVGSNKKRYSRAKIL